MAIFKYLTLWLFTSFSFLCSVLITWWNDYKLQCEHCYQQLECCADLTKLKLNLKVDILPIKYFSLGYIQKQTLWISPSSAQAVAFSHWLRLQRSAQVGSRFNELNRCSETQAQDCPLEKGSLCGRLRTSPAHKPCKSFNFNIFSYEVNKQDIAD